MSAAPSAIIVPISCRLCAKKFTPPAGLDLTEAPTKRTATFVNQLLIHLRERHPQHAASAAVLGQEYAGMLMLCNFNISGEVRAQADEVRRRINTATRAVHVTDERIGVKVQEMLARVLTAEQIADMMQPGGLGGDIVDLIKRMRDVMNEEEYTR